ncbi:3-oxoacyl-[acyl-carrier-protein] synthase III C-terminal domain-containing protein [Paludibacter sp.]|uniref:type III polyketide synthase n=1 Tax=Paludibacter sp. TaxID=1898105 RepID=UPI0013535A34|nr:3-oxoacyl-[acyl-carrier-protein] synthase III C-terminal domain-containing protein [Paludibacter sp.]MTK52968.1 type III polyketide synthase [Paludibacter sp.]
MPTLAAISKTRFPFSTKQQEVKQFAKEVFAPSFPHMDKLLSIFDHTEIDIRNLCKPFPYYSDAHTFEEQNAEYIRISLDYSVQAIESCIASAQIAKEEITDLILVSTTGLSTPSLDALIINKMRLNRNINRIPVFGLGCGGGVSGFAKASIVARENPDAVVLFLTVELCSLTFLQSDFSKSNFVGSSLFSDGVAACIITGDNRTNKTKNAITFLASQSNLYYDSLDVMGWEFLDKGMKVLFSKSIPDIISQNIKDDVDSFLSKHKLQLSDIRNFIFHPGGTKVLTAYEEALSLEGSCLNNTRKVMRDYGNMSSATVMYVLERCFSKGFTTGYGLMLAMGPGFSSEMVLLQMKKN